MPVHGSPGPIATTVAATYVTVHGTTAQLDLVIDLIEAIAPVVIGILPAPCEKDPHSGCHFIQVAVLGELTAEQIRTAWLAVIAANN